VNQKEKLKKMSQLVPYNSKNEVNKSPVSNIKHPCRILACGRSRLGKTHLIVNLLDKYLRHQIDIFIIICPTFSAQKTFDPIRHLVTPQCTYEEPTEQNLRKIKEQIVGIRNLCIQQNRKSPNICVLIDDCSGLSIIHGHRRGIFANFSVQTPHWNTSLIVITQQPTAVDPNFRDNAEHIIAFPSENENDVNWLRKSYNPEANTDPSKIKTIIDTAWKGGRSTKEEWGQHFLYIYLKPRAVSEFYMDFTTKLY
jgi:hypothetical protein